MRGYSTCTFGSAAVRLPTGRQLRLRLLPLALPVHQLFNARLEAPRAVGQEAEFRHVAHPHPLLQFIADVALGGLQAGHGLFFGLGNVLTALSTATYTRADLPPGFNATSVT
jgi:hypothetical protein